MDVTVASPEGYDLDPWVIESTRSNCATNGRSFESIHDPVAGYEDADVVYSRNWVSPNAYVEGEFRKAVEVELALRHPGWTCSADKMSRGNNPLFIHPMPVDRGHEVTDEVASGPRSIIIDIAENRLHVQKAIMGLTMGNL
jgi:ornithine carbamoyltransferase